MLDPASPVLYTPLDDKPKRTDDVLDLARVRDIAARPDVTILVDRWDEDWSQLAWLRCGGRAALVPPIEPGHAAAIVALREKYPQYATHDIGSRPLIAVTIERVDELGRTWQAGRRRSNGAVALGEHALGRLPAIGTVLDRDAERLEQSIRGGRDLRDRRIERLAVAHARLAEAADLADVLAGGGLQFTGRRRFPGTTQGLDASAHTRTVRPSAPTYPRRVTDAAAVIAALGLRPHPEGGWWAETWRAPEVDGARPVGSAILYLLAAGERSHWHTLRCRGGVALRGRRPARARGLGGGAMRRSSGIGSAGDVLAATGHRRSCRPHAWQAARSLGAWTLVGCIVVPAFEFATFRLAPEGWEPPA